MAFYRDPEPITPEKPEYDISKVDPRVANYTRQVREKMYGIDTREAMARAEEITSIMAVDAKTTSEEAILKANIAKTDSEIARSKAETALANSESTQRQLDTIVIEGDSSVEAAQARVDVHGLTHNTLKERIDNDYITIKSQLTDYLVLGKEYEGGIDDNHYILTNLIDKARTEGKGLYIPNGKYYISDDITIEGILNIVIDGELIIAEGKKLRLVGIRGEESYNISIRKVTGTVRLSGFFNSHIRIMGATTLELYANGDLDYYHTAMAYNEIMLGRIENLRIFSEGATPGWINENTFYGGRIFNLYIDGNYPHNNNIFYNPKIENGHIEIQNGSFNYFYDVRLEGENTIIFGESAQGNKIFKSWLGVSAHRAYSPQTTQYEDSGVGNEVINLNIQNLKEYPILKINPQNYNMNLFNYTDGELLIQRNFDLIYNSGIHELNENFSIYLKSDKALFRLRITLYDENMAPVQDDEAIGGSVITYISHEGFYDSGYNVREIYATLMASKAVTAKYFSFRIQTGNSSINQAFKYLEVSAFSKKDDNIQYLTEEAKPMNRLIYNRRPEVSHLPPGTIVYHGAPADGRAVGWIYDGNAWLTMGQMTAT